METLDKFCRFCAAELDPNQRSNIFEPENSHLLKAALECVQLPMSAEDCYPNYACFPCAYKLNDFTQFQCNGVSSVNLFDNYVARNNEFAIEPVINSLEEIIKNGSFDDFSLDFVEAFLPKPETRSENTSEQVEINQVEQALFSSVEQQHQLENSFVNLTRCDDFFPTTETLPELQVQNGPLLFEELSVKTQGAVEKQDTVETQNPVETFNQPDAVTGKRKHLFGCDFCDKSFRWRLSLIRHIRTHTNENSFKCEHCGKCFRNKCSLVVHSKVHTEEKSYQCKLCNQNFKRKMYLFAHVRSHTGEKSYQCDICKRAFTRNWSLKNHIKVHTEEKPFKCTVCNCAFAQKLAMVSHSRIHKGEKMSDLFP